MLKFELTPDEAQSLRGLLDLAVKAGGMQAAEFAVPIDQKIMAAAKALQAAQAAEGKQDGKPEGAPTAINFEPVKDEPVAPAAPARKDRAKKRA